MPDKTTICFIINPISGTARKLHLPELFQQMIPDDRFRWEIKYTDYPKHATLLAEEAVEQGFDIVVAVGGDGTINEVAQSIENSSSSLGIIPLGSGNGLARHLGIPLKAKDALSAILSGNFQKIDTCKINDASFFCTSGLGFDGQVSHVFAQNKDQRGFWNYVKSSFDQYFNYQPKTYGIQVNGKRFKEKAFIVTVANAGQYGNGAYISPEADISDGLFDLCIMKEFPWFIGLWLMFLSFTKQIHKSKYLKVIRANSAVITAEGVAAHLDGDPLEVSSEVTYKIASQNLRVCVL